MFNQLDPQWSKPRQGKSKMSDSGKQIGDCQHAKNPAWCVECLRRAILELVDPSTVVEGNPVKILVDSFAWKRLCALVYGIKEKPQ